MANIGCCYDEGGRGLARNVFVAAYWFTQGAEAGNPAAQQKLGCYLRDGIAMNRDVSAWSYFIFGFSFSFIFHLSFLLPIPNLFIVVARSSSRRDHGWRNPRSKATPRQRRPWR